MHVRQLSDHWDQLTALATLDEGGLSLRLAPAEGYSFYTACWYIKLKFLNKKNA